MKAFLYGVLLQFKLDIRSKAMLITCYVVPLIFFVFMGGVFTSVDPAAVKTLIPAMSVFVVSMSALIGLPPSLAEVYGGELKKAYQANGVPLCQGVITQFLSSLVHAFLVCMIIFAVSPFVFQADIPSDVPMYFCALIVLLAVTLAVGCVLGLLFQVQSKLTMIAMILFLPSIMLSGIMFPAEMLPDFMRYFGYAFPATLGYLMMTRFELWQVLTLLGELAALLVVIWFLLRRIAK